MASSMGAWAGTHASTGGLLKSCGREDKADARRGKNTD